MRLALKGVVCVLLRGGTLLGRQDRHNDGNNDLLDAFWRGPADRSQQRSSSGGAAAGVAVAPSASR